MTAYANRETARDVLGDRCIDARMIGDMMRGEGSYRDVILRIARSFLAPTNKRSEET